MSANKVAVNAIDIEGPEYLEQDQCMLVVLNVKKQIKFSEERKAMKFLCLKPDIVP